ncbi:vWA domain-containing protein [Levilactobacillus acidifarinae]|uniref:VWA-like domain-containing protein n=1 Tax=Levilactobacillus acidifarinae DSM 19394 = JCM 15949 TaxID=1423715 RepID=A0A0R1LQ73_9LACO|nr:VWA-like domain-containing protein [Levilactobacillus acidifarinae]KRK94378.1 hypothetical protein FD25_GL000337 [Levilactobacillus acidifarinae DSM 19394]GEO68118.1 hypothetical protein LAC03_00280 [Levilactobacillus acidifarinae]
MVNLSGRLTRLSRLPANQQALATRELIQMSDMYLLQHDPFYGRVLSQLAVTLQDRPTPLGLRARETDWQLVVSPRALAQTAWTGAQWLAMLRHVVLHLVWDHPDRYAAALRSPQQASLVRWATDAAVNDYLDDLPADAVTSRTLQQVIGHPVAAQQDSAVYWQALRHWRATQTPTTTATSRTAPTQRLGDQAVDQLATATPQPGQRDGHLGWQAGQLSDQAQREQWRQQVLATTATALSAKQRGTLPGQVQAALTVTPADHPLNWQGLLQRQLGRVPAGRQPAYGRFNRRQPQRMELPGQTVQTWQNIRIFVDESGSMGNQEIAYLLSQLTRLLALYPASIRVYPFDTVVHDHQSFTLNGRVPDVTRVGGGGTIFQAIFDALPRLLGGQPGQLAILLTDGYGEDRVTCPLPLDVIWLLTSPVAQFSVHHAPGRVISLAADPQLQALRGNLT